MKKAKRSSNIELLRIVAMLLIISHHYVVNSGITAHYDYSNVSAKMIFLQFWGLWGKTAINAFVMITGYFMCTSSFKWIKYAKLYSQVLFYSTFPTS